MRDIISRTFFTNWINLWRDHDVIKVVTGIRRCGKTTLLEIYRDILQKDGIPAQRIISINFPRLCSPLIGIRPQTSTASRRSTQSTSSSTQICL